MKNEFIKFSVSVTEQSMMKKIVNLLLLLMIGFSFACQKEEGISNTALIGKWNWVSTDGGFGYHIHESPATTGKKISILLSKDYHYTVLENNSPVASGIYKLSLKKSIYSGEIESYLSIAEDHPSVILNGIISTSENNVLTISENHADGLGSKFELANTNDGNISAR